jgi:hypothetical protein
MALATSTSGVPYGVTYRVEAGSRPPQRLARAQAKVLTARSP